MDFRRKSYKTSGTTTREGRRRREDDTLLIRKSKRGDALYKKRADTPSPQSKPSEVLPDMVKGVLSDDPALQLEATIQFRKFLCSDPYPSIEKVIKAGVVPRLADFLLKNDMPQIQYEAAWIMTNLSFGTSEHIQVAIENGVIPKLVQLLNSSNIDGRELAVWALGNIVGDSPVFRDLVLMHGGLLSILHQINEHSPLSVIRNATWVLGNFFRGKPPAPFEQVRPAFPALKQLILYNDSEVLKDACWALRNLSAGTPDCVYGLIDMGICPRIVEILESHSTSAFVVPLLITVGNIASADDRQIQLLIDSGLLSCLFQMISGDNKAKVQKEACWTLSNITATNKVNIQAVIHAHIIQALVKLLNFAEYVVKVEAAWAISNALYHGSDDQIRIITSMGCIEPLCKILSISDTRTVLVCLEGLESILRVGESDKITNGDHGINEYAFYMDRCGCLEKIEALQEHGNNDVYKKAITLIETYWDDQER